MLKGWREEIRRIPQSCSARRGNYGTTIRYMVISGTLPLLVEVESSDITQCLRGLLPPKLCSSDMHSQEPFLSHHHLPHLHLFSSKRWE